MPNVLRLWAGILKNNGAVPVSVPVALTLTHPVAPATPAGTCLTTLVSAGYVFLRHDTALYTQTRIRLSVSTAPGVPTAVRTFGIGGEFKFARGTATYVGLRANRPLAIDAIAASVSAAPVSGAPPAAGWGTPPRGLWQASTDFLYLPASACRAANLIGHQPGPDYDILRLADPTTLPRPAGAISLLGIPLASSNDRAVQTTKFASLVNRTLQKGDCLIAFERTASTAAGLLDVENQSTLYLRSARDEGRK